MNADRALRRLELREVWIALPGRGGGQRLLVPPLNFCVPPGEVVTLMGPSGCGKSSLLAYLCGTLDPAMHVGGRVLLGDVDLTDLPPERRYLGILFQDDLLFPHLSVGENLAFGLPPGLRDRAARRARVETALAGAGLGGFADRDPVTLSGGQRARGPVAHAVVGTAGAPARRAILEARRGASRQLPQRCLRPCPRACPADAAGHPRPGRRRGRRRRGDRA